MDNLANKSTTKWYQTIYKKITDIQIVQYRLYNTDCTIQCQCYSFEVKAHHTMIYNKIIIK